ncbi:MAG TPA: DUF3352 domain-containing protein [Thermoleophilaceae bacterium]
MRRALAVLAAAAVVALAGCGGDDDKSTSPLDEALAYLPRDAPAIAVLETDPAHQQWEQVDDLIQKFAVAPQIRDEGKRRIAPDPLDFDEDLRPQLGNELVVGVPEPGDRRDSYVLAIKVKDAAGARSALAPKLAQAGLESRVEGGVLVAAPTRELVDSAVERSKGGDHMTEDALDDDLGRLAEGEPLLRVTGDLQRSLDAKDSKAARDAIPWLGALRRFAAVGRAQRDGLSLEYDVRTENLEEADLPLAPGPESPPVPRREGEIAMAVREPGRPSTIVARLRDYLPRTKAHATALNDALKRIGMDLERDLLGQFGDVGAASFPLDKTYVARADLKDPRAFAATLAKLARELPGAARGDIGFTIEPGGGDGFYRLNADRGRQLFVGVVGDQVALGEEAGRARDFAQEQAAPVPGAHGSLAFSADAQSVANAIIERRASGALALLGQLATDPLGELRGWAETTPTGIAGHAELKIE